MKKNRIIKGIRVWILSIVLFLINIDIPYFSYVSKAAGATSGECGDSGSNITWSFSGSTLTFSGSGRMKDYSATNPAPWASCGGISKVIFDDNMTYIGDYAFYNISKLCIANLPQELTEIGDYAFYNCDSLSNVKMYDNVKIIGNYAYADCMYLGINNDMGFSFPASIEVIGNYAFYDSCKVYESMGVGITVKLPKALHHIGSHAFNTFTSELSIPCGITEFEDSFTGTQAITKYGGCLDNSFANYIKDKFNPTISSNISMDHTYIENDIDSAIYEYAFDCTGYNKYFKSCKYCGKNNPSENEVYQSTTTKGPHDFSDSVCSICHMKCNHKYSDGSSAIINGECQICQNTNKTSGKCGATDSDSVTWSLRSDSNAGYVLDISGTGKMADYDLSGNNAAPWSGSSDSITSVNVEEGITSIGAGAFANMPKLSLVSIAGTVTEIGSRAFYNDNSLVSISLPCNVTKLGRNIFEKCNKLTAILCPQSSYTFDAISLIYGSKVVVDDNSKYHIANNYSCKYCGKKGIGQLFSSILFKYATASSNKNFNNICNGTEIKPYFANGTQNVTSSISYDSYDMKITNSKGEIVDSILIPDTYTVTVTGKNDCFGKKTTTGTFIKGQLIQDHFIIDYPSKFTGSAFDVSVKINEEYKGLGKITSVKFKNTDTQKVSDKINSPGSYHPIVSVTDGDIIPGKTDFEINSTINAVAPSISESQCTNHITVKFIKYSKQPSCEYAYTEYTYKYCNVCGKDLGVTTNDIPIGTHKKRTTVSRLKATCICDGFNDYYPCKYCNRKFKDSACTIPYGENEEIISKETASHVLTYHAASNSGSDYCQMKEYWSCDLCKKLFSDKDGKNQVSYTDLYVKPDDHVHSTGTAIIENEIFASCDSPGSYDEVKYCTDCLAEVSRITKYTTALGHNLTHHNRINATETNEGCMEYWSCSRCNKIFSDSEGKTETTLAMLVIPKLVHQHILDTPVYTNITEPTCTTKGSKEEKIYCRTCKELVSSNVIEIQALGHDMLKYDQKNATCTTDGNKEYYCCRRCNKLYLDNAGNNLTNEESVKIKMLGHIEGNHTITTIEKATCTKAGSQKIEVYCSRCNTIINTYTETVVAKGHTRGEEKLINEVDSDCENDGYRSYEIRCTECNALISNHSDKILAKGHDLKHNFKVEATEDTDGQKEHWSCKRCNKVFTDDQGKNQTTLEALIIPAIVHVEATPVKEKEIAPTCIKDGSYEKVIYCKDCGKELSRIKVTIPATGHIAGSETKTNEIKPDCINPGSKSYEIRCTVCKALISSRFEEVPAKGHVLSHHPKVDATESKDGCKEYWSCSVCNKLFSDENAVNETNLEALRIGKIVHVEGNKVIENQIAATCTQAGHYDEVIYCKDCKLELQRKTITISPLGHDLTHHTKVEATEIQAGCKEYWSCKRCNKVFTDDKGVNETTYDQLIISKLNHIIGDAVIENIIPATCENNGSHDEVYYCINCNNEINRRTIVDKALGHKPGVEYTAATKDSDCVNLGYINYETQCSVCKKVISKRTETIKAKGHSLDHHSKVEATDIAEGRNEYWSCNRCNKIFSDSAGTHEISLEALKIPMIVHREGNKTIENKVDATCVKEGYYYEVVKCIDCNKELSRTKIIIPAKGHINDYEKLESEKEPDCINKGSKEYVTKCKVCKAVLSKRTESVPALGHILSHYAKKEATPNEDGCNEYWSCNRCNRLYLDDKAQNEVTNSDTLVIKYNGHIHNAKNPIVENRVDPTCNQDGYYYNVVYCSDCNCEISRQKITIPSTGHTLNFVNEINATSNSDGHSAYWECKQCHEKFKDQNGTNIMHDDELIKHNYNEETEYIVFPDCTNEGEYYFTKKCSNCGDVLYKSTIYTEPKTDHDYYTKEAEEATCDKDGHSSYEFCIYCNYKKVEPTVYKAKGHQYDAGVVKVAATTSKTGLKEYTCKICNSKKTEVIPKLNSNSPVTTDVAPKVNEKVTDSSKQTFKITDTSKNTVEYVSPSPNATKVNIPASVVVNGKTYTITKIANNAFKNNKKITSISLSSKITSIGKNAFDGCSKLKTITISSSVKSIEANAFKGCKKLKTLIIKSTKLTNKTVKKKAFSGVPKNAVVKVPKSKLKAYTKLFRSKGLNKKCKIKKK